MAIIFESIVTDILVGISTLLIFLYWFFTNNFDYWEKRNVAFCKPTPFFGNVKDRVLFRKAFSDITVDLYKELEGHKLGGLWIVKQPVLLIRDPDIIKNILVKDFSHFEDRGLNADEERNPLSAHLLNLSGSKWRALRAKLTPTFTSGKMRMMFSLMNKCASEFAEYVSEEPLSTGEIEVKEALAKFTTDVIGSCAFGLQLNAMKNPDSEFRTMGRRIFEPSVFTSLRLLVFQFSPKLARILNLRLPPPDISDFFLKVVNDTVEYREKNNVKRNDFLQLLIELKNKNEVEDSHHNDLKSSVNGYSKETDIQDFQLTNNLLAAQAFVFFLAGFETSSTTMSYALHELTVHRDIQEKVQHEIDRVLEKTGGEITYEALQQMEYLDNVISETLRKHPPVSMLPRVCTKAYREPVTGLLIEEGVRVTIPVHALHHDPKYYPEPEKFDPNRFTEEEKSKRHHYVYLPFGEGPRICIGLRFGLLQSKLGLAVLLSRFEFSRHPRTPDPLVMDPKGGVISTSLGGIWVRLTPRKTAQ